MESTMRTVTCPGIRLNLIRMLEYLELPANEQDPHLFQDAVNDAFNGMEEERGARDAISVVLYDEQEAAALQPMLDAADALYDKFGPGETTRAHLEHPAAAVVRTTAAQALLVLTANDARYSS